MRKSPYPRILAATLFAVWAGLAAAQAPDPDTPEDAASAAALLSEVIEVRVINVDVVVTDRAGVPVAGLGPEAFELEVDGQPMEISNFYAEVGGVARESLGTVPQPAADPSFRPLEEVEKNAARRSYVVVLIDHQRLRAPNRKRAFNSLRESLARLGDDDLVAVVGIEKSGLVFYSDFLYDRQAVGRILDRVTRMAPPSGIAAAERRQIFGELTRGMSGGILSRNTLANPILADEGALQARIQAYAAEEYERSIATLRQMEQVILTLAGVPGRTALLYVGEGIPTRPGEGLFVEWRNRFGTDNPDTPIGLRRTDFNTDYFRTVGRYDLTGPIDQLAQTANRAGVTLYAVDAEGDHGGEARSALTEQGATSETVSVVDANYREPLDSVTRATGGRLLQSSGTLTDQMVNLLGDFDHYYSLGFSAPDDWQAGSSHDIKVKVNVKGLSTRHRDEVGVPLPDEREANATVAALRYQTADNPLEIEATPGARVPRDDGTVALQVTLNIPVGNLELLPVGGRHSGSLSIFVSTKDAKGDTTRVQKIPFNLAIPDEVIEQALGDKAHYDLPLVLRAGDQQVAIGIRDDVSGRFSTVRLDVARFSPGT